MSISAIIAPIESELIPSSLLTMIDEVIEEIENEAVTDDVRVPHEDHDHLVAMVK